ncbi:MAG: AtpZ/AtpI family protein [Hyphomicrobiales bacterium]
MSDDEKQTGRVAGDTGANEAELAERFRRLEEKLASGGHGAGDGLGSGERSKPSAIGQAFRLSSELVAGVAVGFGMGWGIDKTFDTTPWGMIVFLFLGFAAGVLNLLRATGQAGGGAATPNSGDEG